MDVRGPRDLIGFFKDLPDPRASNVSHPLPSLMAIALLAALSGADDWPDVACWGQANQPWLCTFLDLPHGIPSHDTFGRVFALLDPDAFEACFRRWMAGMAIASNGKLIAIDGKTLRRSFEAAGGRAAIHMVSAWVQFNHAVLGQVQVGDKSNEITAIPRLLEVLDLDGATVSIDAMGCQKEIAAKVIQGKGHYLLAVKDNQPTLYEEVRLFIDEAIAAGWEHTGHSFHREEIEADHGRIETRRCWATWDVDWFRDAKDWAGFASIVCVESVREAMGGKTSTERRYYISSHDPRRPSSDAAFLAGAVRGHWGIENRLHWSLDVTFGEDQSRVRKDHAPQNLSRIRRLCLNLLRAAPAPGAKPNQKVSLKTKRFLCCCSRDYLIRVISPLIKEIAPA
jgi:predicted transposase YbfD/YdcC